jgi:hypothetical protein
LTPLKAEVERVLAAGVLGRSGTYIRLLTYLAEAAEKGMVPKEIDLATDVLGRVDFDSVSDSTARVYVHNLRQKLEAHYRSGTSGSGPMLAIPKGKYQLVLKEREPAAQSGAPQRLRASAPAVAALVVALAAVAFLAGRALAPGAVGTPNAFAAAPVWRAILDDTLPITVVVGDYFIFAQAEDGRPGNRLIREFSVNSPEDFRRWQQSSPSRRQDYVDIHLTYLPTGAAAALNEVLAVLRPAARPIVVVPQSQFRAEQLRATHVIYLGYLSGMGQLGQFPFLASRLAIGDSFDELIDSVSGQRFESSAGPLTEANVSYEDFGYVSTFPGPAGNQFLYLTGMRDEGLMQMASILGNLEAVTALGAGFGADGVPAFEALYQVTGIERTYVAAKEVFAAPVDASKIWMDTEPR